MASLRALTKRQAIRIEYDSFSASFHSGWPRRAGICWAIHLRRYGIAVVVASSAAAVRLARDNGQRSRRHRL